MGAIFTPGLTVSERCIVQRDRRLPLEGEVLVEVGDRVGAGDVVARTELPGKVYPVNVANELGVDPAQLRSYLLKQEGERVTEGEVIGRTRGILGFFATDSRAIVTSTLESISTVTGIVIFQADPIAVEIDAYINGKVVEVIQGEGCVVQASATLVQGIFGLGGEVQAELAMAVDAPDQTLAPADLDERHAGKIVVGGAYVPLETFRRAAELGVRGLVTGGFDYDEIKDLLGYEIGVAVTGGEKLGLSLVVTEGFGRIEMAPATFELLRSKAGQRASLDGATQIRAGVIRPEIVVTHDEEEVPDAPWVAPEPEGIAVGDTVRGIRSPWFGRIGRVESLPVDLRELPSETQARVLEVVFADGTRALVPRSNVESIER